MFSNIDDEYMRERAVDIKDVGNRIIRILQGKKEKENKLLEKKIIFADDLTPSDTASLDTENVLAFITREGSRTSHTAIMARSLEIPAVVGIGNKIEISSDDIIIVDANEGKIFVNPEPEILNNYKHKIVKQRNYKKELSLYKNKKARTKDGKNIEVAGNIGNLNDLDLVIKNGAEGIGLFRTEFLFMDRKSAPSEDEQFEIYKNAAKTMNNKSLIIRTLDIGGDKNITYLNLEKEMNPFLGYRAIRMYFDHEDIYKSQLRAILRASNYGNIKIMFPMISTLKELLYAKKMLNNIINELKKEGVMINEKIEVGIMIEIPSAALTAEILAKEVDFFSIGTNDLIQYTMAVDRTNKKVNNLHSPYHLSVLYLINKIVEAAHNAGIWIGMCGEAAADIVLLPFLIGVGLDELSMSAVSILRIKKEITNWTISEAEIIAKNILQMNSREEIIDYLENNKKYV